EAVEFPLRERPILARRTVGALLQRLRGPFERAEGEPHHWTHGLRDPPTRATPVGPQGRQLTALGVFDPLWMSRLTRFFRDPARGRNSDVTERKKESRRKCRNSLFCLGGPTRIRTRDTKIFSLIEPVPCDLITGDHSSLWTRQIPTTGAV